MPYKVIFRSDAKQLSNEHPLTWEPDCPLQITVLQISRDTQTGNAFLQVKIENVSTQTVGSFSAIFTAHYSNGTSEDFSIKPLDADIAANGSYTPQPFKLSSGEVDFATGRILEAHQTEHLWKTSGEGALKPLPKPLPLSLSKEAQEERRKQLSALASNTSLGSLPEGYAYHAIRDEGDWWQCSCGTINMGHMACRFCKIDKEQSQALENEQTLLAAAEKRKIDEEQAEQERKARIAKGKKIGIIGLIIALIVLTIIAILLFVVRPAINAPVVTKVEYYSGDGSTVSRTTTYELDEHGNRVKETNEYAGGKRTDVTTYQIDETTGIPTLSDTSSTDESHDGMYYSQTIDEKDSQNRATKITRNEPGDETTSISIEYYDDGYTIEQVTTNSEFTVMFTGKGTQDTTSEYDANGFRTYYVMRNKLSYPSSSSWWISYDDDSENSISNYFEENSGNRPVSSEEDSDWYGQRTIEYEYDAFGNIVKTYINGNLFSTYEYSWISKDALSPWAKSANEIKANDVPF